MLYLIVVTTRASVIVSDEKPAKCLYQSVRMLKKWQDEGAIKFMGLTGPFTPMKTMVILEAKDHDEVFERIESLPGTPYTDTAIYPLISIDSAYRYLESLAKKTEK